MTAERESMTLRDGRSGPGGRGASRRGPRGRSQPRAANATRRLVAKPKRRKFTAQYRLRILEEAESCTQPGEVGRLLRREGLYSSHLTEWRRARREGSLQGLTPSKRGRKPAERNPLSAKVHELEAKVARRRRSCTPPIRSWTSREKLPGAGIQPRTREGLLMAVQPQHRRSAGAGVPSAGGATGFLLPSSEARSRASAAPSYARPGPVCVRTRARPRRARQPALRRPVTGRGRRDAAR